MKPPIRPPGICYDCGYELYPNEHGARTVRLAESIFGLYSPLTLKQYEGRLLGSRLFSAYMYTTKSKAIATSEPV